MTTATRRPTRPAATPTRDWRHEAACAEVDPELFFPIGGGPQARRDIEEAKKVCGNCTVRTQCLDWAVETGQSSGVWGGLSEEERRGLGPASRSGYDVCLEQQEYIERRVAEGATHRTIADELNVARTSVGRAWRFFRFERSALAASGGEGA